MYTHTCTLYMYMYIVHHTHICTFFMYMYIVHHAYIPYSRKYWRGIIFGGYCTNCVYSRRRHGNRTVTAKFTCISAKCNPFSSNPPNIIPANISGYTVCTLCSLIVYTHMYTYMYMYIVHHTHVPCSELCACI